MKRYHKYIVLLAGLLLLVIIRSVERSYFNDGLIYFFEHDYLNRPLPGLNIIKTLWIDSIRYLLNSIISIWILSIFFKQKYLLTFLMGVYAIAFLAGISLLYYQLNTYQPGEYLGLFYTRRLLIQPLLLLVLFPALLYQKSIHKKNSL